MKSGETSVLEAFVYLSELERQLGGALSVDWIGCPCSPVRNDIVTPASLVLLHLLSRFCFQSNSDGPTEKWFIESRVCD